MTTNVPEKIGAIIDSIDIEGNAPLTRLTVLKKWFEHPGRLSAFGLWIARKASGRKGKTKGEAGELLDEARKLLGTSSTYASVFQQIDRAEALSLHNRARDYQNAYEQQQFGPVRVIKCWPVLLVEKGLSLHLGLTVVPSDGYKLAADWAQHYDSKYGNGLNGTSCGKLMELLRYMNGVEAIEDYR